MIPEQPFPAASWEEISPYLPLAGNGRSGKPHPCFLSCIPTSASDSIRGPTGFHKPFIAALGPHSLKGQDLGSPVAL